MAAARTAADKESKISVYNKQMQQLGELRQLYNEAAMASGQWHVQTVQNISASEKLTQQINKQKLGWSAMVKEVQSYRAASRDVNKGSALRDAIQEQQALRNAMASQMTGNAFGKNKTDLYIPKNLGSELESARVKYGMINQMIASAAHQTVNWGKNTQWAGRQITVGLTMPLGMAAVGAAALALKVDQELTRVAKVYDTTADTAIGKERELAAVRKQSLEMAARLAGDYGMSMEKVIDIQAQLAATGMNGTKLFGMTDEVARVATLGEMDTQTAIDMTVSLTTAFRDQIQTTQDLTETFDFFNTVENATSLQIKDIAAAIPRAASAMSALGVTTKEMTTLMVALRESGVDPEIGANALKSATSTLLDPSQEAIDYWKETLHKDLPAIVKAAGGNLFKFMQSMGEALHGLDPQIVQTAVTKTFGKYQFDRATALVTNFGDAMTGTANQTAKSMELMGDSARENADAAASELTKLQESVSFKFKAAVESVKASLVPIGLTVLEVLTPVISAVGKFFDAFNELGDGAKKFILFGLAIAAVVGPALMLIGIFANLFGNIVNLFTWMGNLRFRFKALNAEEAAAAIMANNAKSAFNSEAQSAAVLAQHIKLLTAAMEENAVAQGLMMGKNGIMMGNGNRRQIEERIDKNGKSYTAYAAGSVDASGNKVGGRRVGANHPDAIAFGQMKTDSAAVADNSEKTSRSMKAVGKVAGGLAALPLIFMAMSGNASSAVNSMLNVAMIAGSIGMMFPGIFTGAIGGVKKLGLALKAAFSGQWMGRASAGIGSILGAGKANGARATLGAISDLAPRFMKFAGAALRVFGPIGLLAGGALIVKRIVDDFQRAEELQRALGTSGKVWADTIGYTYAPGQLPGMDKGEVGDYAARQGDVNKLKEANEGLAAALKAAAKEGDDFGRVYEVAMQQALRAIATGATPEQARKVMEIALHTAGLKEFEIDKLMVRFDRVELINPEKIRAEIARISKNLYGDVKNGWRLGENDNDSFFNSVIEGIRGGAGGDLSSAARTAGIEAGQALADGLRAAGDDPGLANEAFQGIINQTNGFLEGEFDDLINSPERKKLFDELGIKTADDLAAAMSKTTELQRSGKLSGNWQELFDMMWDPDQTDLDDFQQAYYELVETIIQGMGEAMDMDQGDIDEMIDKIHSLTDLKIDQGLPRALISTKDAMSGYSDAVSRGAMSWSKMSDAEKLATLNTWRARAGLEAATHWTQAFGNEAKSAATDAEDLAEAIESAAYSSDQLSGAHRNAMSGAWGQVMGEASRLWEEHRQANIDGIRQRGDDVQDGLDRESRSMDKAYDQREKSLESSHEATEKAVERSYDNRIEAAERERDAVDKAFEARIEKINKTIEAEREAEDNRQAIFEREQQRIERTANRLNSEIDFNVALNSGNLDEAAKIANDVSAREQQWAFDDADTAAKARSEERIAKLETEMERIEAERDRRKEAYEEQLDQIKKTKDAALEALRTRQDAEKEALRVDRQNAAENIRIRKDAAQRITDADTTAAQKQFEADKRSLANRLRALQEFVPQNEDELRAHTREVETIYKKYGIDLTTQGKGWASIIGDALKYNIASSAAALQTDIKWQIISKNIADQVGAGMGMTSGQVIQFLQTGQFPAGKPVTTTPWKPPSQSQVNAAQAQRERNFTARHSGGDVPFTGGKAMFSQADRVGVRRSASIYPSEVPTVLKAGEFVVNNRAAAINRDALEAMNKGQRVHMGDSHLPYGARHSGGPVDFTTGMAGLQMAMTTKVFEAVIKRRAEIAAATAAAAAASASSAGAGPAGAMGGGNMGSGAFSTGGSWPPARSGVVSSNTAGAVAYIKRAFPQISSIGTLGNRPNKSDHPMGKAADFMIPGWGSAGGNAIGDAIAKFFVENPNAFGTKYVIWRKKITSGGGWRDYTHPNGATGNPTLNHYDHVHASFKHKGGVADAAKQGLAAGFQLPNLNRGGIIKYDNTLANLHRDEAVLTAPLTEKLREGGGVGGNITNINLDLRGAYIKEDVDIERAVDRAIEKRESKTGRRRVIR